MYICITDQLKVKIILAVSTTWRYTGGVPGGERS